MTLPTYASREAVKDALDIAETARANRQIDRLLAAATSSIELLCHRRFYPERATRFFDWPSSQMGLSWRLWLDQHEVITVDTLTSGGVAITDYFLEPQGTGPPYSRIELDLAAAGTFGGGDTFQRSIAVTGLFGYRAGQIDAGQLTTAITAATTQVPVTDSATVGVGDVIRIDDERMVVAGKQNVVTGQTLGVALTASKADVTCTVVDGFALRLDELILVDAERMRIVDIAPDRLVVERAADGSVLAAHSIGAPIHAPRKLTVTRAALGTTAALHNAAAPTWLHEVPAAVRSLCIAETLWALQMEGSGYARVIGAGEGARQASAAGLKILREDVRTSHGRTARKGVI